MCPHMYLYTKTYTQIHSHHPPHVHTDKTEIDIHRDTPSHTCIWRQTQIHAHAHTCTLRYTHRYIQPPHAWTRQTRTVIRTHTDTQTCTQIHTPMYTYRRQTHINAHAPCRHALWPAVWGEYAWQVEAPLAMKHGIHSLQAAAFLQRQKMGLLILIVIIISNTISHNSKQDHDAFGVYACFSEFYL